MIKKAALIDDCDVAYAMAIVGGKWKLSIIWALRHESLRLSQLRRAMPGVSEAVLILQLRQLQEAGLVSRKDYGVVPPKVSYSLSPVALDLLASIASLESWGARHRASH